MPDYFGQKLYSLLPQLYQLSDESGDLQQFLKIPAETLDELKALIDRFPDLFDVDRCEEKYLPLLGAIVGFQYDPMKNAKLQRRLIKESIEFYRRKGTIPAIDRSLTDIGWQGRITETFRKALRLNRRSVVGRSRLPGKIFSLGVFRVENDTVTHGIREALIPHHPAGTKAYFLQWLYSMLSMETCFDTAIEQLVRQVCLATLDEAFVLNQRALNRAWPLNFKRKTWCTWAITNSVTLLQDIQRADVCILRWEKRRPGFHLNIHRLNHMALVNVWSSEKKQIISHEIETHAFKKPVSRIHLKKGRLNRDRIGSAKRHYRIIFRQKDFITLATIMAEQEVTKHIVAMLFADYQEPQMQAWGLHQTLN